MRGLQKSLQEDQSPLRSLGDAIEEAVEFLAGLGVRGPSTLPYAYQLVTLAALAGRFHGLFGDPRNRDRLQRWFWITTYTEHFTGITGNRIRDGIEALYVELTEGAPALGSDFAPIKPLTKIRMATVRARAFLLFLAQLPPDADARRRRQEQLGTGETRAAPSLLSLASTGNPGNCVIAHPRDLRMLRTAIQTGQGLMSNVADEFGIPAEALRALPDQKAFLEARGIWLSQQEKLFIESFNLKVSDSD